MPDFILNKLVRDNLPDLMKSDNQIPLFRVLEGNELQKALLVKLKEETDEAINAITSDDTFISELADIQEIIDSLLVIRNIQRATLVVKQEKTNSKKGSYQKGYFLEKVFVDEASEWTQYYRNEPDRFTEAGADTLTADVRPTLEIGIYEHYKGNQYEVLGLARHTETLEFFVVYKPLDSHDGTSNLWIRPYQMFIETVSVNGKSVPRFKKQSSAN